MHRQDKLGLKKALQMVLLVWTVGFVLNLIWENAQAPLYSNYNGFYEHFWVCFVAAVIDAFVILLLYLLFVLINLDLYWPQSINLRHLLTLIFVGGVLAILFEKWALSFGYWAYTEEMPVIPALDIGLVPLLQLMILPFLTFWVSSCLMWVKSA